MAEILIVEDEHALGSALALAVRRLGHLPSLAASGGAALEILKSKHPDALVLDIGLPDMSGLEVLERIRRGGLQIPVLVITAHATLDHAIASQKLGVADYLTKPLDLRRFEESLSSLVAQGVLVGKPVENRSATLIGAAPCMREVFLGIARACSSEVPVLVHGPGGSGKTLAAQVIHANGSRGSGSLRMVECAAMRGPQALELAMADREGTTVLKEVTELDPDSQSWLAHCLARPPAMGPRWIATSRHDPETSVRNGSLRQDLFYAFSALNLRMPSLAERVGDLPALSQFLLGMQDHGHKPIEITATALCAMQAYAWPGNVRELRHVLEHAHAMSRGGPLFPGHLPPHVAEALHTSGGRVVSGELTAVVGRWLDSQMELIPEESWHYDALMEQVEATVLGHLMERFGKRPTRLAAAMRLNRATLRQKLRRAGITGEP
jgi:DNA-binding NtrC family response regulator